MSVPSEPELSEEELAYIKWQEENSNVWGDQDKNGVDLARLRENLKRTPAERLHKLDRGRYIFKIGKNARTSNPVR